MPMIEEMEATGNWLFRWRRYLPLVTVFLFVAGLKDFAYPLGNLRLEQTWETVCLGVSLLGLLARVAAVGFAAEGTSGRNREQQIADSLNTTGIYSLVRNPLYLGNFFIGLGVSLLLRVWWVCAIYLLVFLLYYERIIFAEEMFLRAKFGETYLSWAKTTPMLVLHVRNWRPPALPLNWRKILRQEHQTLFGIVVVFYILNSIGEWRLGHNPFADAMWNAIGAVSVVLFAVARVLHKLTRVLKDREPAAEKNAGETSLDAAHGPQIGDSS
jgi:protein-S-isoprenylcysteine O-methyltransferase Ste14